MKKPDELVVVAWGGGWGKALRVAVSTPFEKLTGIRVRHQPNIGLEIPDSLVAALERGDEPPCHVVWAHSVSSLKMAARGWCVALDDTVSFSHELSGRARALGAENRLVFPYVVYYVLSYHDAAFPNGPPETWDVLLELRFAGKIALYPGGNGFYAVAQVMGGGRLSDIPANMEPCWNYFRRLRPQIGTLAYSVGQMAQALATGELDICFRALTNALAFRADGLEVSWAFPREGVPDTTDALWVPIGLPPHLSYWAKRYVDFALTAPIQSHWCELLGTMPIHRAALVPSIFRRSPGLPQGPDDQTGVLHIPDAIRLECESAWAAKFDALFSGPRRY